MVHIHEFITIHTRIIKVGNATGLAGGSNAGSHLVLVTHNDEEGGSVLCIFVLDEGFDGISARTDFIGIVHIHIDTFHGLPSHPILDAILEHPVGDDQHFHRSLPKVGMIIVKIINSSPVEQLLVKHIKIGAVSTHKLVFGGTDISAVKADSDLNVVEHTQGVVDGVVAHRLDAQLANPNATHGAVHADTGDRLRLEATARLVGGFVIYEVSIFVFEDVRLTRH